MANEEHLKILGQGVEAWNAWRAENPRVRPDLSGAVFLGAELSHADLSGADLCHAFLSGANLSGANFDGAKLSVAYLDRANLSGAHLSRANLIGTNLLGANLSHAQLKLSNLRSAELRGANLKSSSFLENHIVNVDLRRVKGLESVNHQGPSTIGTDTLTKSHGKIPEKFLKGCGLNDWQIAAAKLEDPDLTSEEVIDIGYEIIHVKTDSPIQVNPIFISYSHENGDFIDALEPRFDKKRIRYWRDIHHATAGPLEEIVDKAMRVNSIVLLVLSEDSVESDWVEWEVRKARKLAKDRKEHVLCPIALDKSWKTCPWPERLRDQVEEYNILDFSQWRDEAAMGVALQKLIEGLGIFYPKQAATTGS